ncbi:hypothetical protein [Nonomuraea jabiensis]|uniref:DNA-directed RNA polymerase specialized sigma24 family protein n=1 Tax=Nonomuraea jabiensis TaxID=882448 RepID=A0A7W9G4Q8_9ACTN|nr:hypothetical protein [Nonomuraea jabiensis]MBB5777229.1 DNA-directed RNA polymerase specialized sigma24 family protein [Nonomuraea jabiensis]
MKQSGDLSIFLANYSPSFARTAYLLTGDADRARELAVEALVTACRRWSTIRWGQPAVAALRELYAQFLAAAPPPAPEEHALATLPPTARAVLVARYHDALPPEQVAMVTGLWTAALEEETHQALTLLRAAHPELFTRDETPEPGDVPSPEPEGDAPSEPEGGTQEAVDQAPWVAPEVPPGTAQEPEPTPWTVPAQGPDTDDPGLRAVLVRIALGMPHLNLSEPVLTRIGRRRRTRVTLWATVSAGAVGAFAALVVIAVSNLAGNLEKATGDSGTALTPSDEVPMAMPDKLGDPIRYAYTDYCEGASSNSSDPRPCGQWRLTTLSGKEWRLPAARAGYDEETLIALPLAISQDGHRLAYRHRDGSYVVHDLPTGVVKKIDIEHEETPPHITSSPNGRYFALDFGAADGAMLDFETGATRHVRGTKIKILAVGNDGTRVVSDEVDVNDVPGHASVATLTLQGARGRAGGYRVDPGLLEYGAALSPDGRTLALVSADERLVTMNARTGRVFGSRTALDDYGVIAVERWLSADEVLVRQPDEDDEDAYLTRVDVRSGKSADYGGEEWIGYDSPLGALK